MAKVSQTTEGFKRVSRHRVGYFGPDRLARHTQAAENKSRKVDMLRVAKDAVPDIGLGS